MSDIEHYWMDPIPALRGTSDAQHNDLATWRLCYADRGAFWFTPDMEKQSGDGWSKDEYGAPYLPSRPGEPPLALVRILAPNHEPVEPRDGAIRCTVKRAQARAEIVLEHDGGDPKAHVRLGMTLSEVREALDEGRGRICIPVLIYRAGP